MHDESTEFPDEKECKTSCNTFETIEKEKVNRVLLNGYWIWWCYEHNMPLAWCEKNKAVQQGKLEAIKEIEEFVKRKMFQTPKITHYGFHIIENKLAEMKKKVE